MQLLGPARIELDRGKEATSIGFELGWQVKGERYAKTKTECHRRGAEL